MVANQILVGCTGVICTFVDNFTENELLELVHTFDRSVFVNVNVPVSGQVFRFQ